MSNQSVLLGFRLDRCIQCRSDENVVDRSRYAIVHSFAADLGLQIDGGLLRIHW